MHNQGIPTRFEINRFVRRRCNVGSMSCVIGDVDKGAIGRDIRATHDFNAFV